MSEIVININDIQGSAMRSIIKRSDAANDHTAPKVYDKKARKKDREITLETSSFKYANRLAVQGNRKKPRKRSGPQDIMHQHQAKMRYFQQLQDSLSDLEATLEKTLDRKARDELAKRINDIKSRSEENAYYLDTMDVITKYQEMLDKEEDESECHVDTSGQITKFIGKYDNVEKQKLIDEYNQVLNNGQINLKSLTINAAACKECEGELLNSDGYLVCSECGTTSSDSALDLQVSYKDIVEIQAKTPFAYKKANRFKECLQTAFAKENTEIPEYVYNAVMGEIDKEKNFDMSTLDFKRIKYYLRRLSLPNYYDHAACILSRINGQPPPSISAEIEEQLDNMFKEIQEPFEEVKCQIASARISFLSYKYVLYKMFELLDMPEFLHLFPLLKSTDKLKLHDRIWKGICEKLEWEFIPSI